ncbi:ankyrin repeat domain-containing protein [Mesorhizobium sp. SP-1A]|uniref:ankyrin repeat domain-containing protein n=1 Tax=Mesorhizobium sp. SP-1A TaxID=3077840 RepID=UPI0028F70268|nr:ankyrin repeat domain-containing protein [Mesorhizobium sp. SP-1A]
MSKLILSDLQKIAANDTPELFDLKAMKTKAYRTLTSLSGVVALLTIAGVAARIEGFPDKVLTQTRHFSYVRKDGVWSVQFDPFKDGIYDLRETSPQNPIGKAANMEKWVLMAMGCYPSQQVAATILPFFYAFEDGDFSLLPEILNAVPIEVSRRVLGHGRNLTDAFGIEDVDGFIAAYKGWAATANLDLDEKLLPFDKRFPVSIQAAMDSDVRFIKALFDLGASPNAVDPIGMTPLLYAISYQRQPYVEAVVKAGASPSLTTSVGSSLHALSWRLNSRGIHQWGDVDGVIEVAKMLIKYGADKMAVNDRGQTAVQELRESVLLRETSPKNKKVLEALVEILS